MTLEALARLVVETRRAQAAYFRCRSGGSSEKYLLLEESKRLERALDKAADEILTGPGLFDRVEIRP